MNARVVLYTRPGCHLCDDARRVVRVVCTQQGAQWAEVSIDDDPDLASRYGEMIPVVTVDDAQIGYFRIDPQRLAAALQ